MGQIPRTGRGTNSSNHGAIKWNGGNNIPRIRTRVRNPYGVWGWLGKKKGISKIPG